MDSAIRALLESADDPDHCEHPAQFDWARQRERVIALQPVLEHIAGRRFVLDDRVQDASFFADLSIQTPGPKPNWIDTVFALRFSNFADLFSTWSHGPETLDHAVAKELVAAVAAAGFHFVPYEALQEPYTGRCGAIRPKVWWIRFFDYL